MTKLVTSERIANKAVRNAHVDTNAITSDKLASDAVGARVYFLGVYERTGLAADATGVKYEGPRIKVKKRHLKAATLRATWTASHSDSVTAIEVYNVTKGQVVGSVSGNTGDDQEVSLDLTKIDDGDLVEVRVNVTTASATSGATTDVKYAVVEFDYYES